jgi:uncharacterized phage-like protein YoqJ
VLTLSGFIVGLVVGLLYARWVHAQLATEVAHLQSTTITAIAERDGAFTARDVAKHELNAVINAIDDPSVYTSEQAIDWIVRRNPK